MNSKNTKEFTTEDSNAEFDSASVRSSTPVSNIKESNEWNLLVSNSEGSFKFENPVNLCPEKCISTCESIGMPISYSEHDQVTTAVSNDITESKKEAGKYFQPFHLNPYKSDDLSVCSQVHPSSSHEMTIFNSTSSETNSYLSSQSTSTSNNNESFRNKWNSYSNIYEFGGIAGENTSGLLETCRHGNDNGVCSELDSSTLGKVVHDTSDNKSFEGALETAKEQNEKEKTKSNLFETWQSGIDNRLCMELESSSLQKVTHGKLDNKDFEETSLENAKGQKERNENKSNLLEIYLSGIDNKLCSESKIVLERLVHDTLDNKAFEESCLENIKESHLSENLTISNTVKNINLSSAKSLYEKGTVINSESLEAENETKVNFEKNNNFSMENRVGTIYEKEETEKETLKVEPMEWSDNFATNNTIHLENPNDVQNQKISNKKQNSFSENTLEQPLETNPFGKVIKSNNSNSPILISDSNMNVDSCEDPCFELVKNHSPVSETILNAAKPQVEIQVLLDLFEVDNITSRDIILALSSQFLKKGATQAEVLNHLRKKETPEKTGNITKLKKDISMFFKAARKAEIFETKNRRYFLKFEVGEERLLRNTDTEKVPKQKNESKKRELENHKILKTGKNETASKRQNKKNDFKEKNINVSSELKRGEIIKMKNSLDEKKISTKINKLEKRKESLKEMIEKKVGVKNTNLLEKPKVTRKQLPDSSKINVGEEIRMSTRSNSQRCTIKSIEKNDKKDSKPKTNRNGELKSCEVTERKKPYNEKKSITTNGKLENSLKNKIEKKIGIKNKKFPEKLDPPKVNSTKDNIRRCTRSTTQRNTLKSPTPKKPQKTVNEISRKSIHPMQLRKLSTRKL